MNNRIKILSDMISSYNNNTEKLLVPDFSVDWIIKMLGLKRNEVRKYKIRKLFDE
jgi:hypothetical protein